MIQRVDAPAVEADPWFVVWTDSRAEKKVEKRIAALWRPRGFVSCGSGIAGATGGVS